MDRPLDLFCLASPPACQGIRVLDDGTSTRFAAGFTNVVDMAFGRDGSLCVLKYDADGSLAPGDQGALWKIAVDGGTRAPAPRGPEPSDGPALDADGAFYIPNFGGSAGGAR